MSETISVELNTSGAGVDSKTEPRFLKPAVAVILFALAIAVVTLRFHRLDEIPPGLFYDEGANGLNALEVLRGNHSVYFPENHGREPLGIYLMALAISVLGRTELAIRLPTALASGCTVFAVFWLGRLLFGRDGDNGQATPWRGLLVGGLGAGLMAVSLAQTIIGRTSFRVNFLPLLLTLCLALLWEGWRRRSWWQVALAGACAGLLAYTYIAARFTPFLFLFLGLSFLMPWARSEPEGAVNGNGFFSHRFNFLKSRLRAELPLASVFVCVSSVLAAPILIYFVLNPNYFFLRSSQVSVFQPGSGLFGLLWAMVANVWEHLLAFGILGDPSWRHNYSGLPLLNLWQAFFFWLGVGTAVWRWKQPSLRLLLLSLALLLLPALLSRDSNVPHFLRMLGATPAMYLLTGVGAWETIRFLRNRFLWRQVKWAPDWRREGTKAATIVGATIGLILVQGVFTYQTYFQKWAISPEVYWAHQVEWANLVHTLNEQPTTDKEVYLLPYRLSDQYSFDYLYQGSAPAHVIRSSPPQHVGKQLESVLAASKKTSVVKIVDWKDHIFWSQDGNDTLGTFLSKYGRFVETEEFPDFRIHAYTDITLDRPWTIYDFLEPLAVNYDRGISLLGFALGQGPEQLSSQGGSELIRESPWWVALQWQTAPGLEGVYSISLRLYDTEGRAVYQQDAVLKNSTPLPTNRWQAEELVETLHFLEFPSDLSPGEYQLRLVVYDFETLKPTVELGVWEAEKTIAKLQVGELK